MRHKNRHTEQQEVTTLSSSQNADERLDHLRCKKGGTLNVSTRIEPLNSLLSEESKHAIRTLTHAASWYIPLNTVGSDVKQC